MNEAENRISKEASVTLHEIRRLGEKIRQGAPIVEYDALVKIDWETMTGKLTAPQDQAEKELSRLRKRMSTDKINVTVTNESSRENPIFDLKGILSLPDLLPGALKIAYLTAFKTLGDAFLDECSKSSVADASSGQRQWPN
jgi:hypothetical protein